MFQDYLISIIRNFLLTCCQYRRCLHKGFTIGYKIKFAELLPWPWNDHFGTHFGIGTNLQLLQNYNYCIYEKIIKNNTVVNRISSNTK